MMPSLSQPRRTHNCITSQIRSKPARVSASLRQARSFSSINWLIDALLSRQRASSSAALWKGCVSGVVSSTIRSAPAALSSTTKPPPTE